MGQGALPQRVGLLAGSLAGEVVSAARCALQYPLGLAGGRRTAGRPSGRAGHDTPVVLVHGYAHNRSAWRVLEPTLRRAGFTSVHTFSYVPLGDGVPGLAGRLADRVEQLRRTTGAERVHLVGHSLGGILARWYVQELDGAGAVDLAVTLATPHQGTPVVAIAPERTARDLLPGSAVIGRLAAGRRLGLGAAVPWVAYQGGRDLLVPAPAGELAGAVNIGVPGLGHLALLLSSRVAASVTRQLEAADGSAPAISRLEAKPAGQAAPARAASA